jgi:hypothetical protein
MSPFATAWYRIGMVNHSADESGAHPAFGKDAGRHVRVCTFPTLAHASVFGRSYISKKG